MVDETWVFFVVEKVIFQQEHSHGSDVTQTHSNGSDVTQTVVTSLIKINKIFTNILSAEVSTMNSLTGLL